MSYDMSLEIDGEDLHIELKGIIGDIKISGLERIAKKAMKDLPLIKGSKKPKLTKDEGYRWLEQGKDYDWFKEHYDCTRQQVAAYKAWKTMRNKELQ